MTEPSFDLVEDRLRRTLGQRAEDMAPGDAVDGSLGAVLASGAAGDEPSERRWLRRPSRPLLVAASVLVVALAVAAVAVVAGRDDGTRGQVATEGDCGDGGPCTPPDPATVDLVIAPRDLAIALQDERNMASIELLGMTDAIKGPVDDSAAARARTDEARAAFAALASADPGGSAYPPALLGFDDLAAVRADVDADDGPQDMSNAEAADEVFDRYTRLVGSLLDAQEAFVSTLDDPALQPGAELYVLGLREQDLTARLTRAVLMSVVEPTSAKVTEVGRLSADLQHSSAELTVLAAGTRYEDPAAAVTNELEVSGYLDAVGSAIEGTTDIVALLEAADDLSVQGWPVFLEEVEHGLTSAG